MTAPDPRTLGIAEVAAAQGRRRLELFDDWDVTTTWGEKAVVRLFHDPRASHRGEVHARLGDLNTPFGPWRLPAHVGRSNSDQLFFVFPPVPRTVASEMAQGVRLDEFAAFNPVFSLVGGLGVLHEMQLVHGRIEPSSVAFTERGSPLLDHLPLVALPPAGAEDLAELDEAVQPEWARYASPQLLGLDRYRRGDPTPADDVFAIAAVIQASVTGRPPAGDVDTPMAAYLDVRRRPVPVADELPTANADLLRAAMSWDPRDRPTAEELSARMAEIADPLARF